MAIMADYDGQIISLYVGESDEYRVTSSLEIVDYGYCQVISVHDVVEDKKRKCFDSGIVYADVLEQSLEISKAKHVKHLSALQKKYGVTMLVAKHGRIENGRYVEKSENDIFQVKHQQTSIEF